VRFVVVGCWYECIVLLLPSMLCRVDKARGKADAALALRCLPSSGECSSGISSWAPPAEYSDVLLAVPGLADLNTSSCNALILCQVRSLRPTGPRSNSFMKTLLCSIASRTSPDISCSRNASQCERSTPLSSRYSATRCALQPETSSSVYMLCSSSSVSCPAMKEDRLFGWLL
jgi:hypothetical protein